MRAAKGSAVGRVGSREGSAILEGGETYASAGGHGNGNALYLVQSKSYEWMPQKV